jgi:hypothetical protein
LAQWREDRHDTGLDLEAAAFCLGEGQLVAPLHLWAQSHSVGAAHAGVEEQIQGETGFGSHGVALLELLNSLDRPSVKTIGVVAGEVRDIASRVVFGPFGVDGPLEYLAQRLTMPLAASGRSDISSRHIRRCRRSR